MSADEIAVNYERLPKHLKNGLFAHYEQPVAAPQDCLQPGKIYHGDAICLLPRIAPNSVALGVWSPPYFVGKRYESHLSFDDWQRLIRDVVNLHYPIIKPGGFLAINIADILCFRDQNMPKVQAENLFMRRSKVTREDVLKAQSANPAFNRYQLAKLLGCSEQTIDRRLNGNNIRGGKYETQTRVKIVGGLVQQWAEGAGFYPYDRRIWVKDAAWENSKWSTLSYRSVDEFEYLYIFWKPGVTRVDRSRLTKKEWSEWGYRGVWIFPSVRVNDDHEAKFPVELPRRVIRLLTDENETVLDCFIGSGTSAIAAIQEKRKYIGIEIQKKSVALANRNLKRLRKTAS